MIKVSSLSFIFIAITCKGKISWGKLPDKLSDLSASIKSGGRLCPFSSDGGLLLLLGSPVLLVLGFLLLGELLQGAFADCVLHHVALAQEALFAEIAKATELGGVGLSVELFIEAC